MRQRALQAVLLVHAIEQTDLGGDALSLEDRVEASRAAADGRPLPAAGAVPPQLNGDSERFLTRRADALLARLRVRSPGVDRVLAAAAGPGGLDRAILLLGFLVGFAAAFTDGTRIDIFAYPLVGLVLWNLIVYIVLIVRTLGPRPQGGQAGGAAARGDAPAGRDGFFRRWLARLYANRVRARIETLITHSIGFNAPLAPGLRRFAADWWEVGRPVFRERARRLLHLTALLAAVGLMAGYGLRGWVLRQSAGWGTTVFGPASAHAALVTLYGAASAVSGVAIPAAGHLQALAWTSPSAGGGPAGQWLYLIDWTALLYIALPRLIAVIVTTLSLWRRSASLRTPPSFAGYLGAVLRSLPASSEAPPAEGSSG
jgi:hypothetical protein